MKKYSNAPKKFSAQSGDCGVVKTHTEEKATNPEKMAYLKKDKKDMAYLKESYKMEK